MKITMLIEDEKLNSEEKLNKEAGMSIHFQLGGKNILFDTGASGAFIENAKNEGIDLENVDYVVISHGHISHTAGLSEFMELNRKAVIVMSSTALEKHYIKICRNELDISMPKEVAAKYENKLYKVYISSQLSENVFVLCNFIKKYPWNKYNQYLFTNKYNTFVRDDLKHELVMVIKNNGKLIIVTGCSHNGITNIIETVLSTFPNTPIQAVIGGFHLIGMPGGNIFVEPEQAVRRLGQTLLGYNIDKVYACHCTGLKQFQILKEVMGDKIEYMYTGSQIEL